MGMTEDDKRNCCLLEIQETEAKYYRTLEDIEKVGVAAGAAPGPCLPGASPQAGAPGSGGRGRGTRGLSALYPCPRLSGEHPHLSSGLWLHAGCGPTQAVGFAQASFLGVLGPASHPSASARTRDRPELVSAAPSSLTLGIVAASAPEMC